MSQLPTPYVLVHGAFARPGKGELMEIAVTRAGAPVSEAYHSSIWCRVPDSPQSPGADDASPGVSDEENAASPSAQEVFAYLNDRFALRRASVVMWAGMAYRVYAYAQAQGLTSPFFQTQVIDLQAAVVMHYDLKTSHCKDSHGVVRLLGLEQEMEGSLRGTLPFVHAMNAVLRKLLADGWTPESTPGTVTDGPDIGEVAEEMRIDRWEQIRERQNNLGIERRAAPDRAPAFIILDGEHVSLRSERFSRLVEVALVVAYRKEHGGRATYELGGKPFSSLVQLRQVEKTYARAWEITGIDPEAVRTAPSLPRVMAGMAAAAPWDRGVLVTWGPDDARIITHNCVIAGIPSPITEVPLVDLQRAFSRFYDLGPQQISLQGAATLLEIDTSKLELHRALADTRLTWYLLDRMLMDGWTPNWRPWHGRQAQVI